MLFAAGHVAIEGLRSALFRKPRFDAVGDGIGREALDLLIRACKTEAGLSLFGRVATRAELRRLLENRLALEQAMAADPAIAARSIRAPLFITGLPRSGTTFLHELLAADPANRAPLSWEVMYPPSLPRARQRTERLYRWTQLLAPRVRAIHPLAADEPQECIAIMASSFLSFQFQNSYHVPSYQAWLERQDLRPAYRHHRGMLQWLQGRDAEPRWILKAPSHLFALPALFATYPDARIVQLHRDPATVVTSVTSMVITFRRVFCGSVDAAAVGREQAALWARGLEQALRFRSEHPERGARFSDLHFRDLVRDPLAAVERLYEASGWTLSPGAAAAMEALLAARAARRAPPHRYSLDAFGLDPVSERRRFDAYIERFGVAAEG